MALVDLRVIHQGKPDLTLSGPHLGHALVLPELLHLLQGGCGEVLDNEALGPFGAPSLGQGLPLTEEDSCAVRFLCKPDDESTPSKGVLVQGPQF